jgi:AAA ATPase domain
VEDLETETAWFTTCEQPDEGSDRNSADEESIRPRKMETSNGIDSLLPAIQGGLEDIALSPNQESRPPITTVAFPRNERFYGREKELALVHGNLRRPALNARRCCVLHGIGGVGKTQIALEYTYRYREYYEYIFWIRAEDPTTLSMSYAIIAEQLKLTTSTAPEIQIERVKEWLDHGE